MGEFLQRREEYIPHTSSHHLPDPLILQGPFSLKEMAMYAGVAGYALAGCEYEAAVNCLI